jgi:predicted Zn finger-like uncharacterized protein
MHQKMTIASTQASMVTRCPKCGTAFRITAAQLESAKGAVRCGSCLHVFKAQSSLVSKPAAETPAKKEPAKETETKKESFKDPLKTILPKPEMQKPAPTKPGVNLASDNTKTEIAKTTKSVDTKPAPTKPQVKSPTSNTTTPATKSAATQTKRVEPVVSLPKAANKTTAPKPDAKPAQKKPLAKISDDDDMLISDDMEGGSRYEFEGFMNLETQVQANSLFDRKVIDEKKVIKDNSDESWAENLIDDDDDIPQIGIVKTQVAKAPPISPVQEAKNNLVFNFVDDDKTKSAEPPHSKDLELSDELSRMPTAKPLGESHLDEKEEIINAIPVAGIFHDDEFDDATNKRQLKIEPKIRSYDGSRASLLKNIMPAPLEFAANNIRHWYFRMFWPVMTLLMLLTLVLQLAYFRFDHYSRIQPYRNIYAIACPIVGCKLPTLIDKKQILTYNLSVVPHSEIEQALQVDVMMLNQAGFEQPFPDLLLSFSDMDGQVKASRRFTPKDYLGGELVGKKIMPSKQPIHIILEIKDPQVDNYKIDVL